MRVAAWLVMLIVVSGCSAMVLGGSSSGTGARAGQSSSDTAIAAQIRSYFASDSTMAAYDIGVRSISGNVTLTGKVENYVAREQAGRLAKATNGVISVTNQIVVEN